MSGKAYERRVQKKVLATAILSVMAVVLIGGSISGFAKARRAAESSHKYYTSISIQPGDTLWGIASEYMTPEYDGIEDYIREVRKLNHLSDNGICAGQYLMIPYYSDKISQ